MLVANWYHIPVGLALGVVGLTIGVSIVASLLATRQK
jgi:tellurite resistance protein TerC